MIDCKYCGRHIPYDANVCPYCGRSIKSVTDPAPTDEHKPEQDTTAQYVEPPVGNDGKSNKWLYVIIVILLLLLLCFVGYFLLHQPTGGSEVKGEPADTTLVDSTATASEYAQPVDGKVKPAAPVPAKGKEIVVNGEGVRMRFAPSLKAKYLKTPQGGTLSVTKGTRLPCVGETGDWYKVVYQGKQYYMSKQFCYPAK